MFDYILFILLGSVCPYKFVHSPHYQYSYELRENGLYMAFIGVAIMPVFMKIGQLIQTLKDVNKNGNFQHGSLINVLSCPKKWKQAKESERKELWMYLCDAAESIASTVKIICDNRYKYLPCLSQARCGET